MKIDLTKYELEVLEDLCKLQGAPMSTALLDLKKKVKAILLALEVEYGESLITNNPPTNGQGGV